ncbi:MAG: hypothetical protein QXG65_06105 [Thermoplasmata archaeon]
MSGGGSPARKGSDPVTGTTSIGWAPGTTARAQSAVAISAARPAPVDPPPTTTTRGRRSPGREADIRAIATGARANRWAAARL